MWMILILVSSDTVLHLMISITHRVLITLCSSLWEAGNSGPVQDIFYGRRTEILDYLVSHSTYVQSMKPAQKVAQDGTPKGSKTGFPFHLNLSAWVDAPQSPILDYN